MWPGVFCFVYLRYHCGPPYVSGVSGGGKPYVYAPEIQKWSEEMQAVRLTCPSGSSSLVVGSRGPPWSLRGKSSSQWTVSHKCGPNGYQCDSLPIPRDDSHGTYVAFGDADFVYVSCWAAHQAAIEYAFVLQSTHLPVDPVPYSVVDTTEAPVVYGASMSALFVYLKLSSSFEDPYLVHPPGPWPDSCSKHLDLQAAEVQDFYQVMNNTVPYNRQVDVCPGIAFNDPKCCNGLSARITNVGDASLSGFSLEVSTPFAWYRDSSTGFIREYSNDAVVVNPNNDLRSSFGAAVEITNARQDAAATHKTCNMRFVAAAEVLLWLSIVIPALLLLQLVAPARNIQMQQVFTLLIIGTSFVGHRSLIMIFEGTKDLRVLLEMTAGFLVARVVTSVYSLYLPTPREWSMSSSAIGSVLLLWYAFKFPEMPYECHRFNEPLVDLASMSWKASAVFLGLSLATKTLFKT